MIALRMALGVFITVCAIASLAMGVFNGASLLGVLALIALLATYEPLRALTRGLIADAYGDAEAERTVLDDLDRPTPPAPRAAAPRRVGGWYLTPDECPCPVDHTDACPLDDDVDNQRAA